MRSSAEVSIDLSTDELLSDPSAAQVEIEDIGALASTQPAAKQAHGPEAAAAEDGSIEIELTAEQIDALLSGKL
jgi:hypothetical protein